jgi:hypothetical protein
VILALLLLCVPTEAEEQGSKELRSPESRPGVWIHDDFYKGRDFRLLSERERRVYAAGILDGMLLAPFFGAPAGDLSKIERGEVVPTTRSEWLAKCVVGMNDEQVAAIITKYLNDHPERWHEGAHLSTYSAMIESCPGMTKASGDH